MWTLLRCWWRRVGPEAPSSTAGEQAIPLRVAIFEDRSTAQAAARAHAGLVAIYAASGNPKWAYLECPCGCGSEIALNLMASHRPVWRIAIRTERDFSIYPSVDSSTCGAHFWVHDGQITWADWAT